MKLLGAMALGLLQPKWVCYVVTAIRSVHHSQKLRNAGSTDTLAHMEPAKGKSTCQNNLAKDGLNAPTQVTVSEVCRQRACDFFIRATSSPTCVCDMSHVSPSCERGNAFLYVYFYEPR